MHAKCFGSLLQDHVSEADSLPIRRGMFTGVSTGADMECELVGLDRFMRQARGRYCGAVMFRLD